MSLPLVIVAISMVCRDQENGRTCQVEQIDVLGGRGALVVDKFCRFVLLSAVAWTFGSYCS